MSTSTTLMERVPERRLEWRTWLGSFMVTLGGVAWCRKCLSNVEVDGGRMEADGGYDVALFCSVCSVWMVWMENLLDFLFWAICTAI